jgi:hypothetical protein
LFDAHIDLLKTIILISGARVASRPALASVYFWRLFWTFYPFYQGNSRPNLRFLLIIPMGSFTIFTIPMAVFGMKGPKQNAGEKDNHPNHTANAN